VAAQPEAAGLVFRSERGGLLWPNNAWRSFGALCAAAGVAGGHPHRVRHTFASHLLAQGRPITEVSAALGHANSAICLRIYAHFIREHGTGPSVPADLYGNGRLTRVG
jgi:integrase